MQGRKSYSDLEVAVDIPKFVYTRDLGKTAVVTDGTGNWSEIETPVTGEGTWSSEYSIPSGWAASPSEIEAPIEHLQTALPPAIVPYTPIEQSPTPPYTFSDARSVNAIPPPLFGVRKPPIPVAHSVGVRQPYPPVSPPLGIRSPQPQIAIPVFRQSTTASTLGNLKPEPPTRRRRKICGLNTTPFLILTVALSVVVILLVVALCLHLFANKSKDSTNGLGIFSGSQLAATNWTGGSDGIVRNAIFYQDESNAIMVSIRDSFSNQWTSTNVTASVMNTSSLSSLDVLPGTPLACVTNRYQVSIYYLNKENGIAELYSPDPAKAQWYAGSLGSAMHPQGQNGSRLAAYWQLCQNCSNSLLLLYQDEDSSIQMANFTNGVWAAGPTIAKKAVNGSGLGISTFTDNRASGGYGTDTNALRVYYTNSTQLFEEIEGPETGFNWETGNNGNALSNFTADPHPTLTSITYGGHGWDNNLVAYLTSNGTFMSHVWTGNKTWEVRAPTLIGTPGGLSTFNAMASSQDMRIWALANGTISEYETSESDPFTWKYVGPVTGTG